MATRGRGLTTWAGLYTSPSCIEGDKALWSSRSWSSGPEVLVFALARRSEGGIRAFAWATSTARLAEPANGLRSMEHRCRNLRARGRRVRLRPNICHLSVLLSLDEHDRMRRGVGSSSGHTLVEKAQKLVVWFRDNKFPCDGGPCEDLTRLERVWGRFLPREANGAGPENWWAGMGKKAPLRGPTTDPIKNYNMYLCIVTCIL
jgi:hypothetical protein